jgi:hypothetical protein
MRSGHERSTCRSSSRRCRKQLRAGLGEAAEEIVERPAGHELVAPAEGGDQALPNLALLAVRLDDLEVGRGDVAVYDPLLPMDTRQSNPEGAPSPGRIESITPVINANLHVYRAGAGKHGRHPAFAVAADLALGLRVGVQLQR